jgi:hypothetical protein
MLRRAIVAVTVAVLLTGCGQNGNGLESRAAAAKPNDADVTFVQNMIPRHEQAIRWPGLWTAAPSAPSCGHSPMRFSAPRAGTRPDADMVAAVG